MKINNNFNVLPFYDSLQKLNSNKWYSFGQHYPLICPNNEILPFQFIIYNEVTLYNIEAVNIETEKVTDLGVKPGITAGTQGDLTYYVVKSPGTSISEMPEGLHYLRMNTSEGYIYSEEFVFCDNYSDYIKLEYWNEDTLRFSSGEIKFDDDFRFILYIPSTIGKPEYEFEEELTKRLGYKFIESQTSNKIYKFNFLAPEYICDAMRLVRMCDYIKLTTKYDTYNALTLSYNPKWQENGDLAAVDVEFETDCIIQKLESFNRRLKESFYNALLADIEEPMLFSTDVVAQYYTEYTSVNYINGKLIRQLVAASKDEIKNNLGSIVLPIDNQSDTSQEAKKVFLQDVLGLVDTVSKLFKGHYDEAGNLLWIEALANMGVNGGVTMFIDNGSMSLPSIFDALPIDGKTLVRDANGVLMVSPDIDLEGGFDEAELESYLTNNNYAKKSDIPSLADYATKNYVNDRVTELINGAPAAYDTLKEIADVLEGNVNSIGDIITVLGEKANASDLANYIPIQGYTDILGEKNFTGGLKVNGSPIVYDATGKYWKLEGDLLVTGGVTMYANEGTYTPSTIMDAIAVDGTTISKDGGVLKVIGDLSGGVTDFWDLDNIPSWITANKPTYTYSDIDGTPSSLKNPYALTFGSKTYDGSEAKTILASDLGALTAHQTIYKLTFQAGAFAAGSFTANSAAKTINIPTTTSHISEGTNLYFTNARAVRALTSTLANYVKITDEQTITGKKNFTTGGLFVNGSQIKYDADNKYWKLEGDLLVTGGVTAYGDDSEFTPSTIMDALVVDNTTLKVVDGVLKFVGSVDGGVASSVAWSAITGKPSWITDTTPYVNISGTKVSLGGSITQAGLRTALGLGSNAYSSTAYLPLSGGTMTGAVVMGTNKYIYGGDGSSGQAMLYFNGNKSILGSIGDLTTEATHIRSITGHATIGTSSAATYTIWDSGNHGSGSGLNADLLDGKHYSDIINGNVSSATKLQTARTIWGQSFNGAADITGRLLLPNTTAISSLMTDGSECRLMYLNSSNVLSIGYDVSKGGGNTKINGDNIQFAYGTTQTIGMILNSSGNVTIGASDLASTSVKLYVSGATKTTGNFIFGSEMYRPIPSGGTYKPFRIIQTADYALIQVSSYDGTSANGVLQLAGGLNGSLSQFKVLAGTSYISGKLGLGVSAPTEKLHVAGNILATGGVTMYSDRRKKTILNHVELSLKEIADAPLIEHYYNSDEKKTTHVGSIAQYWAGLNDWFCKLDSEGYYTMEIQNAALASAISVARELVKFETETDRRIRLLEEENEQLKKEIEILKWNIA